MSENDTILRPLDIVFEDEKDVSENYDIFQDDTMRCELKTAVSLTLDCQHRNRLLLSTKLDIPKRKRASTMEIDKSRGPTESFLLTYSEARNRNKIEMEISPQLVSALQASTKHVPRRPSVRRSTASSLQSDKSAGPKNCLRSSSSIASKPKKKVRFAEKVTIHRISVRRDSAPPTPETFIMIINLREIWKKLDLDRDKHLNMSELKRFADKVWEDEDVEDMIDTYAAHPEKGLCFGEWCAVLKEEEGDFDELMDELYSIFVEDPDGSYEEDDEKDNVIFVN